MRFKAPRKLVTGKTRGKAYQTMPKILKWFREHFYKLKGDIMALKIEKINTSEAVGDGIFIDAVTIKEVKDISGTPIFSGKFTPELGFELTLDIGRDFFPILTIAGNLSDDKENWGSAFKVREALLACGLAGELTDDFKIPANLLEEMVGKSIKKLSYRAGSKSNGKNVFYDWDLVFPVNAEDKKIKELFLDQVTKSTYLSRKYQPEVEKETEISINPVSAPDGLSDNIPF